MSFGNQIGVVPDLPCKIILKQECKVQHARSNLLYWHLKGLQMLRLWREENKVEVVKICSQRHRLDRILCYR
jgi:hypothetical protein